MVPQGVDQPTDVSADAAVYLDNSRTFRRHFDFGVHDTVAHAEGLQRTTSNVEDGLLIRG